MLAQVLSGVAAWFVASTVFGILIGQLMAAHERPTSSAADARRHSDPRAA